MSKKAGELKARYRIPVIAYEIFCLDKIFTFENKKTAVLLSNLVDILIHETVIIKRWSVMYRIQLQKMFVTYVIMKEYDLKNISTEQNVPN